MMYLPWNVSLMAMAAAEAILDNPEEVKDKVKYNNDWMDTFVKELKAVGLKPYPAARQLHAGRRVGHRQDDAARSSRRPWTWRRLFLKTIKPINGKDGYFRVTPGTPEECERFVRFVRNYFGK